MQTTDYTGWAKRYAGRTGLIAVLRPIRLKSGDMIEGLRWVNPKDVREGDRQLPKVGKQNQKAAKVMLGRSLVAWQEGADPIHKLRLVHLLQKGGPMHHVAVSTQQSLKYMEGEDAVTRGVYKNPKVRNGKVILYRQDDKDWSPKLATGGLLALSEAEWSHPGLGGDQMFKVEVPINRVLFRFGDYQLYFPRGAERMGESETLVLPGNYKTTRIR